uniref:Uncharacterized protein n=1 Tax=Pseudomonas fluorescens TaxID=294 RepID=A0A5E6XR88_PSEFL|nr:hypothetical protein PS652_05522 [Pseudomonas fluorescens]
MLRAVVFDGEGAPAVVEVLARMVVEVEGQARLQAGVVAFHVGQAGVAAQGGQAGLGEGLAAGVALVAAGVVVAFVVSVLVVEVTGADGVVLQVVVGVGEGVVALHLARAAHLFGVVKAVQGGLGAVAAGERLVVHRAVLMGADGAQAADAVGEPQGMAVGTVLKAVQQAFFGGQAGDEVEVAFAGLDAVLARRVVEAQVGLDLAQALGLEHREDDLGHALALEHPPVRAQAGAGQARLDHGAVAGAAKAGVALAEQADQAVHVAHRGVAPPDSEQRGKVEHAVEVDGRVMAGQFQAQVKGLGQAFFKLELDHLEGIALQGLEGEAQVALAGHEGSLVVAGRWRGRYGQPREI